MTDLLILAACFAALLGCLLLWAWFADLAWLTLKHPWIVFLAAPVFVLARDCALAMTGRPTLSLFVAGAAMVLIVRPALDLLGWIYDLTPIGRIKTWPYFEFEPPADYEERMTTLRPALEWNYMLDRTLIMQQIDFEDERDLGFEEAEEFS